MSSFKFQVGKLKVKMQATRDEVTQLFHSMNAHMTLPSFEMKEVDSPDLTILENGLADSNFHFDGKNLDFSIGDDASSIFDALFYCIGPIDRLNQEHNNTIMIHSSAIIIKDKAYIFQGESNSGKTLLAFAFRQLGFPVLSLDHTLIEYANGSLLGMGGTRALRIKPATMTSHFPSIVSEFPKVDFTSFSPRIVEIEKLHDPYKLMPIGGIYVVSIACSKLRVEDMKTIDYQVLTYHDASKYIRGTYPLNINTPAPYLDTDDLANQRVKMTKMLAENAKTIRGDLSKTIEYILKEAGI